MRFQILASLATPPAGCLLPVLRLTRNFKDARLGRSLFRLARATETAFPEVKR